MGKGAIILGIVFMIGGIVLFSFLNIVAMIYGAVITIIGIALIVFYKEEDKIEQRKDLKK